MTQLLDSSELDAGLARLPGVHRAGPGRVQLRVQATSFADAVRLVSDVAAVAEEMDHHPDIDVRYRTLTFTLSTHSAGGVTQLDLDLAEQIVALATATGASALPPATTVEFAIRTADQAAILPFWRAGLGYAERPTASGSIELTDPSGAGPMIWFQTMDPPRPGRGCMHVDVYAPADEVEQRLADTLSAGGRLVTDEHAPQWWVLADAEGNELYLWTV